MKLTVSFRSSADESKNRAVIIASVIFRCLTKFLVFEAAHYALYKLLHRLKQVKERTTENQKQFRQSNIELSGWFPKRVKQEL
jgi:hypothetical protein